MSGTRSMLIDSTLSIYTGVGSMSGTRSMPTDYSLQSTQGVHHSGMRNVVVARIHSGVGVWDEKHGMCAGALAFTSAVSV